jgi:hypothetical protein
LERGKENRFPSIQTPTHQFFTAPSSCTYHVFALTFEALEALYFCRETVIQYPRCRHTEDKSVLVPEEFVAEDNLNFFKDKSVNEGANADD